MGRSELNQYKECENNKFRFDEKNLAQSIFNCDKESQGTVRAQLCRSTCNDIYEYVAKILIDNNITDPYELMAYMRKYQAIVLCGKVHHGKEVIEKNIRHVKLFEEIDGNITLDALKTKVADSDSKNPFADLYNLVDMKDFPGVFDKIVNYIKCISPNITAKNLATYKNALNYNNNFFSFSTKFPSFIRNDNSKRFDIIIAELFNHNDGFTKFSFDLEKTEFEKFLKNIDENCLFDKKKNKPINIGHRYYVYIGYIINDLFENNNLDFSKYFCPKKSSYYKLICGDKSLKLKDFQFFGNCVTEGNEIIKSEIDKIKIIDFDFTYNEKKYSFTKNGIIKK